MARDPVCGMSVDPTSSLSTRHGEESFYFCSEECLRTFKQDPEKYADGKENSHSGHQGHSGGCGMGMGGCGMSMSGGWRGIVTHMAVMVFFLLLLRLLLG